MNKLICKILGHKFLYNFSMLPNKCICARCKEKYELDLSILEWKQVDCFGEESDEILIKRRKR